MSEYQTTDLEYTGKDLKKKKKKEKSCVFFHFLNEGIKIGAATGVAKERF